MDQTTNRESAMGIDEAKLKKRYHATTLLFNKTAVLGLVYGLHMAASALATGDNSTSVSKSISSSMFMATTTSSSARQIADFQRIGSSSKCAGTYKQLYYTVF
jgi:hypothetical protein